MSKLSVSRSSNSESSNVKNLTSIFKPILGFAGVVQSKVRYDKVRSRANCGNWHVMTCFRESAFFLTKMEIAQTAARTDDDYCA